MVHRKLCGKSFDVLQLKIYYVFIDEKNRKKHQQFTKSDEKRLS